MQEAHLYIEYGATEDVDVLIADCVDSREYRRHCRCGHASRPQALMGVAQSDVNQAVVSVTVPNRKSLRADVHLADS